MSSSRTRYWVLYSFATLFLSQNLVRSNYRSDLVIVSSTLPPSSMATDSRARRLSSSSTLVHISVFFSFIDAPRLFFYMAILVIQSSIVLQDNRSFPVEELGRKSLINAKRSVCPARSSDRMYFLHFVSVFRFVSSQDVFYYSDSHFFSEMVVKATELVKVNDTATGKILYPIKLGSSFLHFSSVPSAFVERNTFIINLICSGHQRPQGSRKVCSRIDAHRGIRSQLHRRFSGLDLLDISFSRLLSSC